MYQMPTRMSMGAKCVKANYSVQRLSRSCGPFEQSFRVGSIESGRARLPPINGWQVCDTIH